MKIAVAVLVVALHSTAAPLACAADPLEATGGFSNGRLWTRLPEPSKLAYVAGIGEAGALCDTRAKGNLYLFNETMARDEVAKAIDQVYSDPTNMALPVVGVYRYVAMKATGASAGDLEAELARLRSTAKHLLQSQQK